MVRCFDRNIKTLSYGPVLDIKDMFVMSMLRLLWIIVCGLVLMPTNASTDLPPNVQFAGGNGLSLEAAVKVLGKINIGQFASAKLGWLLTQYPKSKTIDIEFPCVRGQSYHLHKIRLESGVLSTIYFDASNVSDETIVNGKVRSTQEFIDQSIELVEKSNIPPADKQRMLLSMRNGKQPKKPGECE